jgi:hypothetical protein
MKSLSLAAAKDLADQWADQKLTQDLDCARSTYFHNADAEDLIRMWETGHNLEGGKLTELEFGALVEAWVRVFGCAPPSNSGQA